MLPDGRVIDVEGIHACSEWAADGAEDVVGPRIAPDAVAANVDQSKV
jgi:hypothetical protein